MKTLYITYTHGDEHPPYEIPNALVANPLAKERNVRYIETDLNRSFGVMTPISYEEKRAVELDEVLTDYDLVVDIHRTTAQTKFCGIVTKSDDAVYALPYGVSAVVLVENIQNSLISRAKHGIALEYPYTYSLHTGSIPLYRVKEFVTAEPHWIDFEETEQGIPYLVNEKAYHGKCFLLEKIHPNINSNFKE